MRSLLRRGLPWLIVSLLVLGLTVRLRQYLAGFSYWYDEGYLLVNVWNVSFSDLIGPLRCNLVIPPLFLWLLRGLYLLFGPAEWVMRLPALIFSLAAVGVMIVLARRIVEGRYSWIVALMCALSHHGMVHACEVRPYSSDLLTTELILLATAGCLLSPKGSRSQKLSRPSLVALGGIAPWLSFPSVFVLGAASLALGGTAWRRRNRHDIVHWLGFNGVVALSSAALWWFQARHLYYPGLKDHWVGWDGFAADQAPLTLLTWTLRCFVGIGHYSATGLGVPLLVLAVIGGVSLWRRSRSLAVTVSGPVIMGYVAALARFYPMADRTVFFTAPCVWLLAGVGLVSLSRVWKSRLAWASVVTAGVLIAPQGIRLSKYLFEEAPRCDFRGALTHIEQQRRHDDLCWVSHPEMHEIYCGADKPCLGGCTPLKEVTNTAKGRRTWVVAPPSAAWDGKKLGELPRSLEAAGLTPTVRRSFVGLEVTLYEPRPVLTIQRNFTSKSLR